MNSAQQTQITHNGQTAKINARVHDFITKRQAQRLIKMFGTREFSDGHQVYKSMHGGWILRHFANLAR